MVATGICRCWFVAWWHVLGGYGGVLPPLCQPPGVSVSSFKGSSQRHRVSLPPAPLYYGRHILEQGSLLRRGIPVAGHQTGQVGERHHVVASLVNAGVYCRELATLTYRSGVEWEKRFGRARLPDESPSLCHNFEIEQYIEYQGLQYATKLDANTLLYLSKVRSILTFPLRATTRANSA